MAHSSITPSAATRWMMCAASVPMSVDAKRDSSEASAAGTLTHRMAEFGLRNEQAPDSWLGETELVDGFEITVTERHVEAANVYIEYILQRHKDMGGELLIEKRVGAKEIHPELYGTADAVLINDDTLVVVDLKTGRYAVDVEDNPQLKIYALGVLETFGTAKHKKIETVIVQPTAWHRDGAIRSAHYDPAGLVDWAFGVLKPAALACFEPDPQPVAGDWCRFCPAKPVCPMK